MIAWSATRLPQPASCSFPNVCQDVEAVPASNGSFSCCRTALKTENPRSQESRVAETFQDLSAGPKPILYLSPGGWVADE